MAYPVVANTSSDITASNATSVSVTEPGGAGAVVSGDVIIIQVVGANGVHGGWTPPSEGLTEARDTGASSINSGLYYKVATGSETWPMVFSNSNAEYKSFVALRITGSSGIDIASSAVDDGSVANQFSTPQVTTTVNECLVLHCVAVTQPLTSLTDPTGPSVADEIDANNNDANLIHYDSQASSGLSTLRTWTVPGFSRYHANTVAVAPTNGAAVTDVNLLSLANVPRASLTSLKWSWFDSVLPGSYVAPTDQGTTEATDGSGNITLALPNSVLTSGQEGTLVLSNSAGTLIGAYRLAVD